MKTSQFPLNTVKETPADAEITSHQLMIRAGLIRKLAAGLYTWLPLGVRVLRKVEAIVREEMNQAGGLEVLMPVVQPAELWKESGRWELYGPELARLNDRHQREFCLGPTHEEIITDMARNEIRSYKQLPVNYYQIQTKFRDEIRPRFGVMRSREFIMKDAYSFHIDDACLQQTYDVMYQAYTRIFQRIGLEFRAVDADSGAIGGNVSHEFHVLADSGEDAIAFSTESDYAANIEMAEAVTLPQSKPDKLDTMELIDTPEKHSIEEVSSYLNVTPDQILKTLLVKGVDDSIVALLLRGDHSLNTVKTEKLAQVTSPLTFATDEEVVKTAGCAPGSVGPIELDIAIVVDRSAAELHNFVCGANQQGKHYSGVNWNRDCPQPEIADIRTVQDGDPSPDDKGTLTIARGIEVGHIFQLGTKYSEAMNAVIQNEAGQSQTMMMGCYGIGITRIVAAAIEQNHDKNGIIWPINLAPFRVALLPMNMHKSERLRKAVENLYSQMLDAGLDVVFDDRKVRAGFMFADMELIGIPHRVVLGDRGLDNQVVEYRGRTDSENREIPISEIIGFLVEQISVKESN